MPIFGFFCSVFIPLPILFYRSKLGRKTGGIVPAATILIMAVVLGKISIDLLFFIELMLLGFILGPMMEEYLRRAMILSRGDATTFLTRPISASLLAMSVVAMAIVLLPAIRRTREVAFREDG